MARKSSELIMIDELIEQGCHIDIYQRTECALIVRIVPPLMCKSIMLRQYSND